jgi:hypothetical protein
LTALEEKKIIQSPSGFASARKITWRGDIFNECLDMSFDSWKESDYDEAAASNMV